MLYNRTMKSKDAVIKFESLSSEIRLDIFRLLLKHGETGLVAGEIAEALSLPNTNLSFHLKALVHANMISVEKEGRYLRYKALIGEMLAVIDFLTSECCMDDPKFCQSYRNSHPNLDKILK